MFRGKLRAIKNALYFIRANNCCKKRAFDKAFSLLLKIDLSNAKLHKHIEYCTLRAFVSFVMKNYGDSIFCCEVAYELILKPCEFNKDEKLYLESYISIIYLHLSKTIETASSSKNIEDRIRYDFIDLNYVRKTLKERFPLRGHPAWRED